MSQNEKVTVYTMENCPFCKRAKELLKSKGIPFQEILLDMSDDPAWRALEKRSGMKTMPQIFYDEQLIGGFSELESLNKKDGLKSIQPK